MPDARCDELSGVGIYHDAKPGHVNDATDSSPWKLKPQCETPNVRPLNAPYRKVRIRGYHRLACDSSSLVAAAFTDRRNLGVISQYRYRFLLSAVTPDADDSGRILGRIYQALSVEDYC